jgi:hypothetical protein
MRKMVSMTMFAGLILGSASLVLAQAPPPGPHGEAFQSMGAVHLDLGGPENDKTVKGIPLSADVTNTHVQFLQDGNKITNEETSHFYRDNDGRTRRENKLMLPGHEGDAPTMIMINDPVAHTRFILNTNRKSADEVGSGMGFGAGAGGPHEEKNVMYVRKRVDESAMKGGPGAENETKEDLGTQTIDGYVAKGTRSTHVIPAGKIGNEKPITVSTESWYSDDLGMEVMRVHKDPWMGEMTTKVTNVKRGEQDASLFTPPADYKVEKGNQRVIKMKVDSGELPPPPPQD